MEKEKAKPGNLEFRSTINRDVFTDLFDMLSVVDVPRHRSAMLTRLAEEGLKSRVVIAELRDIEKSLRESEARLRDSELQWRQMYAELAAKLHSQPLAPQVIQVLGSVPAVANQPEITEPVRHQRFEVAPSEKAMAQESVPAKVAGSDVQSEQQHNVRQAEAKPASKKTAPGRPEGQTLADLGELDFTFDLP